MNLTKTEQLLVQGLRNTGPARWAVRASPGAMQYIHRIMAAYMAEEMVFNQVQGLVIGPSGGMHRWWAAGWRGAHLSSVKFMNAPMPEGESVGVACFDRQEEYPAKYLTALDALLKTQAASALFLLPAQPSVELDRVLAAHKFVHVNVT